MIRLQVKIRRLFPALIFFALLFALVHEFRPKSSLEMYIISKARELTNGTQVSCLHQRGFSGRWVLDWDYGNRSSYPNHGSYTTWHLADQNFTATPSQPFRRATSYRWIDDKCPVHEVDYEKFCSACLELEINQILIMGDSLSIEFAQALQSLLGFPPEGGRANRFNARFKPWTMNCPSHRITFLTMRFSPIADWENLGKEAREQNGAARAFISKSQQRTALIANLGTWMQTTAEYKQGFTWFLEWLNSFNNQDKLIAFYRPTIPGHLDCLPFGRNGDFKPTVFDWINPVLQEPYASYLEYRQVIDNQTTEINTNRWELFEEWNDWTFEKLYSHDDSLSIASTQKVYWLNLFNSSVLRRDGHVGFGDCLHYYLPGPPDWWAHFFYSTLLEVARGNNRTHSHTRIINLTVAN